MKVRGKSVPAGLMNGFYFWSREQDVIFGNVAQRCVLLRFNRPRGYLRGYCDLRELMGGWVPRPVEQLSLNHPDFHGDVLPIAVWFSL